MKEIYECNLEKFVEIEQDGVVKRYRPFQTVDELIQTWQKRTGGTYGKYEMPMIWVRDNFNKCAYLILVFDTEKLEGEYMYIHINEDWMSVNDMLTYKEHGRDENDGCEVGLSFLDGSPCGVEVIDEVLHECQGDEYGNR